MASAKKDDLAERERLYMDPTKLEDEETARKAAAPKKQTFKEAFAAARANKQKTFEWPPGSGDKFHTRTKEEEDRRNSSSTASRPPAPKMSRVGTTPGGEAIRQTMMPKQTGADLKRRHDELVAKERQRKADYKAAAAAPRKAPTAPMTPADRTRMDQLKRTIDNERRMQEMINKPGDWLNDIAYRNYSMSPENLEQRQGELTFLRNKYNMPAMAKGGSVESKKMVKKEVAFMKKKGAPKSMIKHEMAEAKGMKSGGMACGGMKKYAGGGGVAPSGVVPGSPSASRITRGPTGGVTVSPAKYARGGGVESHGKTKGTMIKMASGGSVSARADGVAQRGKTNCKIC